MYLEAFKIRAIRVPPRPLARNVHFLGLVFVFGFPVETFLIKFRSNCLNLGVEDIASNLGNRGST